MKSDIPYRRMLIENRQKLAQDLVHKAKAMLSSIESELHDLQRECPHAAVTEKRAYQGGGKYYVPTACQHCLKAWDRYDEALTIKEKAAWDALWRKKDGGEGK